ncbi:integrase domain-containing protein [Photobacterium sp. CCB-ST2H9]|uniref:integrase domain-containing protein n=1 Tax=Photobacterium sp. CCB-ST2H9 TaxID=2912855 RepID=UPI002004B7C4|nr:integrase domain-containing protein [Photobacterium sp. CCB-ST2H9]UTM56691.1 integrase domain-containing protein [Photobacterium sp. CCB-ST2H9]
MAKVTTKLTDKEIKAAKPRDKEYLLFDGDGLRLRIKPSGSKLWLFNYKRPYFSKRTNLSLGAYPSVSLSHARKAVIEAQGLLAQDIDPKVHRDDLQTKEVALTEHTVENISRQWFELKQHQVTEGYAEDIWRSLEKHVFPRLGSVPITKLTAPLVIEILRPVEASGSLETLKRIVQRLNEMMNYAVNCGLVHANPLTGISAAFKKPSKQNMAALEPAELPELMAAIANASIKRTTRCLIEWQLHTMTRPAEASGARWDEIDFENEVWTIPAERMKKRREHRIPLAEQALTLLEVIKPLSGHREYIFPSDRDPNKPCNSQTANMALKRMGFAGRLVSHGLRSLASTTLNEQGYDTDLVEAALAHVDDNQVRAAYNRTDYLERRRPMMCWWSEHIEKASTGSLSVSAIPKLKVI